MSRHKNCPQDCCHEMECCPRGFIEHVQNYRYLKWAVRIDGDKLGFFEYWWHETKSLLGFNKAKDEDYE